MKSNNPAGYRRRRPNRLREFLAVFQWIFQSWRRPADAEARWQQR